MQPLNDQTILITGAGDGLGKALALTLAQAGATIILLGKTIPKLEAVYDEIVSLDAPTPAIVPLDLKGAELKHYEEVADSIQKTFGKLDGLIHNAAYVGQVTPLEHCALEEWQRVIQVNLTGPFLLTKTMSPLLKRAHSASVVFVLDPLVTKGKAYLGAYAASKAGLKALAETMMDEWEHNTAIKVHCLTPPPMHTRLRTNIYPAEYRDHLAHPIDIAQQCLAIMQNI